jgi:hypothetical protein
MVGLRAAREGQGLLFMFSAILSGWGRFALRRVDRPPWASGEKVHCVDGSRHDAEYIAQQEAEAPECPRLPA